MNFEFMPELRSRWGYPAVLLAMGSLAVLMILWFWRRGWLRRS
jgi:magnesium transporter